MKTCAENMLAGLQKVKTTPNGWEACCPAHEDRHASLSIGTGDDGRILLSCHAGCAPEAIVDALGLRMADLFPQDGGSRRSTRPVPQPKSRAVYSTVEAIRAAIARQVGGQFVAEWPYHAADGSEMFRVLRFSVPDGKTYRPIHLSGTGWAAGDPPGPLPLHGLHLLDGAPRVYVAEGEGCADAARSIGLTATTSAHGAKSAHRTDWTPLAGRDVVVLPDHDNAGETYAGTVASILTGLTPPARVQIVRLPDLPEHGDIVDWIAADGPMGSKSTDEIKAALHAMVESAPLWTPTDAAPSGALSDSSSSPVLVCMADVRPEPVRWLWPSRIALGKLTVIAGDPGLGKSFLTLDITARVTTGTAWPDAPGVCTTPGGVVLLSAEDDPGDTIRPRLDAAGADVTRIMLLKAVCENVSDGGKARTFNLAEDLGALETAIASVDGCRMVVVDPISAYLGQTDSHRNSDVRALLAPLSALAARRGVAMVAVTHLRKGEGSAIHRTMGSMAFVAAARAAYVAVYAPDDDSKCRRLLLPVKNNLGNDRDGLAYRLQSEGGGIPRVMWENEPVKTPADEVMSAPHRRPGPPPAERDEAVEWLRAELADGARPAQGLFDEAAKQGITKQTLKRAKRDLGALAKKTRFDGHWTWELTQGGHEARQPATHTDNLAPLGEPGALRENPNENAGPAASGTPAEDEECQDRQVPDSGADTLSNGL